MPASQTSHTVEVTCKKNTVRKTRYEWYRCSVTWIYTLSCSENFVLYLALFILLYLLEKYVIAFGTVVETGWHSTKQHGDGSESAARNLSEQRPFRKIKQLRIADEWITVAKNDNTRRMSYEQEVTR
jgi:hypothetical protein